MKRFFISILCVLFLVSACTTNFSINNGSQNTQMQANAQEYWPADDWRTSTPEEQGMDSGLLAGMIDSIRESGSSVNSITIIRNGYLVCDTYFYPYQKGSSMQSIPAQKASPPLLRVLRLAMAGSKA